MTNLMHTCFILQYVHYIPLHVSSITCSSSGGWIALMQHLVSSSQSAAIQCTGWERIVHQVGHCLSLKKCSHLLMCKLDALSGPLTRMICWYEFVFLVTYVQNCTFFSESDRYMAHWTSICRLILERCETHILARLPAVMAGLSCSFFPYFQEIYG